MRKRRFPRRGRFLLDRSRFGTDQDGKAKKPFRVYPRYARLEGQGYRKRPNREISLLRRDARRLPRASDAWRNCFLQNALFIHLVFFFFFLFFFFERASLFPLTSIFLSFLFFFFSVAVYGYDRRSSFLLEIVTILSETIYRRVIRDRVIF